MSCIRLFEASHKGGVSESVGNHPNNFFNSSKSYFEAIEKKSNRNSSAQKKDDVEMAEA